MLGRQLEQQGDQQWGSAPDDALTESNIVQVDGVKEEEDIFHVDDLEDKDSSHHKDVDPVVEEVLEDVEVSYTNDSAVDLIKPL